MLSEYGPRANDAQPKSTKSDSLQPVLTRFADIVPTEVEWLWFGRFPLGRISLIAGRPGLGKSFLTTAMAADVSRGERWPDGSECPQGSVIFMTAEDDPSDTIRPRLDAAGADVRKVYLLDAVQQADGAEWMISLGNIPAIEAALQRTPDCKLLVVDPIGSFLSGGVDAHRDNEVRSILAPLAKLAEKHGVAVVLVAHTRKSAGTFADDSVLGSRAFTGLARAVWHLVADPDDEKRRLLLAGKNNLAERMDGLAFAIEGDPPKINWESDPVTITADELMAAQGQPGKREARGASERTKEVDRAAEWLSQALAEGPRQAKALRDEWENGEVGSWSTVKRAKKALRGTEQEIVARKERGDEDGAWWYALKGTPLPWELKEINAQENKAELLDPLRENKLENQKEIKEINSPPSAVA